MMYFKFLTTDKGKTLFFSKYSKKKSGIHKWKESLKKVSMEEKVLDADLNDFLSKMKLKKSIEFLSEGSKVRIYENDRYRFFEITNSRGTDYLASENFKILEKIRDKDNTEYILVQRES